MFWKDFNFFAKWHINIHTDQFSITARTLVTRKQRANRSGRLIGIRKLRYLYDNSIGQECTNPRRYFAETIKFRTVAPNVWDLQHRTCFLSPFWRLEFEGDS